jgi:hypothetical protein
MRHQVYVGRTLVWDARSAFPQRNLLNFIVRERGACRCDFGCWETSVPCSGCPACARTRARGEKGLK